METSSNICSTCIPSTTIAGAGQHSCNRLLAYYVPHTEDVGLPTKVRFNVGPASQTIAGSMPVNRQRRWPNTNLSSGLLYTLQQTRGIQPMLFKC